MLICVNPHILVSVKKLFDSFNDSKMEQVISQNIQPFFDPMFPMKYSYLKGDIIKQRVERISVEGDFLSYSSEENDKVGVYIAEEPLTPDTCYFEVEIIDTGMDGSMSIGLSSKRYPLDIHVGYEHESVGLSTEEGRKYQPSRRSKARAHTTRLPGSVANPSPLMTTRGGRIVPL
uniref:SPRY domain-containing protein n=1 Tax=Timema douglasi TaxID=61478 RepID=A0A7R8ZIU3_TIMDO|nr:unnamed protein product [Timema douglasi]